MARILDSGPDGSVFDSLFFQRPTECTRSTYSENLLGPKDLVVLIMSCFVLTVTVGGRDLETYLRLFDLLFNCDLERTLYLQSMQLTLVKFITGTFFFMDILSI